jgi:hypothetical protein
MRWKLPEKNLSLCSTSLSLLSLSLPVSGADHLREQLEGEGEVSEEGKEALHECCGNEVAA